MNKSTGTKRTQKGILRGKVCTKERFCNPPAPDGVSRWVSVLHGRLSTNEEAILWKQSEN